MLRVAQIGGLLVSNTDGLQLLCSGVRNLSSITGDQIVVCNTHAPMIPSSRFNFNTVFGLLMNPIAEAYS